MKREDYSFAVAVALIFTEFFARFKGKGVGDEKGILVSTFIQSREGDGFGKRGRGSGKRRQKFEVSRPKHRHSLCVSRLCPCLVCLSRCLFLFVSLNIYLSLSLSFSPSVPVSACVPFDRTPARQQITSRKRVHLETPITLGAIMSAFSELANPAEAAAFVEELIAEVSGVKKLLLEVRCCRCSCEWCVCVRAREAFISSFFHLQQFVSCNVLEMCNTAVLLPIFYIRTTRSSAGMRGQSPSETQG